MQTTILEDFLLRNNNDFKHLAKKIDVIKKNKPKDLDSIVHNLHYDVFEKIDCLDCARCCKTLGPAVKDVDIARLAKHLKRRPSDIVEEYFRLDSDNDYVFKSMPCPFLTADNYCMVYEARPIACREYPHTNRKKFEQLLNLTKKNIPVCPAVYEIVRELKI